MNSSESAATESTSPDAGPASVPKFRPLASYERPDAPVAHVATRLRMRAQRLVRRDRGPLVRDDRLEQASRDTIGELTASPDCSLLARELDAALADWADGRDAANLTETVRLIVIPPGDREALLSTWAERCGHTLLEPPTFESLVAHERLELPALDGDGVLVVPRLEQWFVRHRHGLRAVRALCVELSRTERRCVVGCNSWAWSYLKFAAGADLLLPQPLVFAPFDAGRLATWLAELADREDTSVVFRDAHSGTPVLARDEQGGLESDFVAGLATRSLGVPWVAWQLWQRCLRTRRVTKEGNDDEHAEDGLPGGVAEDENTLWLVPADEFVLPAGHERVASLVLHALLLHGTLDVEGLALVLPLVGDSNIVPALVRAGFVERAEGGFRCAEGAYPEIMEHLASDGLSVPIV